MSNYCGDITLDDICHTVIETGGNSWLLLMGSMYRGMDKSRYVGCCLFVRGDLILRVYDASKIVASHTLRVPHSALL